MSRLISGLASIVRRIIGIGLRLLSRHPRLKGAARRLVGSVPGAKALARRLRALMAHRPAQMSAPPGIPRFEPAPVGDDGVVTVEALYHLSRKL